MEMVNDQNPPIPAAGTFQLLLLWGCTLKAALQPTTPQRGVPRPQDSKAVLLQTPRPPT